jgi:hypothetical protein
MLRSEPHSRSITVRLNGGLGNQLFQLAAGLHLVSECEGHLVLDECAFFTLRKKTDSVLRKNSLKDLFPSLNYTTCADIRDGSSYISFLASLEGRSKMGTLVARSLGQIERLRRVQNYLLEGKHRKSIFQFQVARGDIYLSGYWQELRLAEKVRSEMLGLMSMPTYLSGSNLELISKIRESSAATIHIRRTDFVEKYVTIYGENSAEYFLRSCNLLREKGIKEFVVFSDDAEWSKSIFSGKQGFHFPEQNLESPSADFWMLAQSKNMIISNSTFSWWAAILSNAKTVVRPKHWKLPEPESSAIYPSRWLTISQQVDDE